MARVPFVTATHKDIEGEHQIPLTAVEHYEKQGWKVKDADLKEAEKEHTSTATPEQVAKAEARADKTASADSK